MYGYFKAQAKRFIKISPLVFILSLIFFSSAALLLLGFKSALDSDESRIEFKIGVTGDTDNKYFEIGMTALNTMDSSRFSLELSRLSEQDAEKKLEDGELSAYLVVPDGFVKAAAKGRILPITFVTLDSNTGLVGMIRDEIISLVEEMVAAGQKGVFGTENALYENGYGSLVKETNKNVNIAFIAMALARESMYKVEETGVGTGLNSYLVFACGIAVVFILISGAVYATVLIRRDSALCRLLISRGNGVVKQIFCDFLAITVSFFPIIYIILGTALFFMGDAVGVQLSAVQLITAFIPATALVCAFNMFIFEITDKIVTGILLQFFSSLFLSYMSGCLYPIDALPSTLQRVAPYLPTGNIRMWLECVLADLVSLERVLGVAFYTVLFLILASIVRSVRARRLV